MHRGDVNGVPSVLGVSLVIKWGRFSNEQNHCINCASYLFPLSKSYSHFTLWVNFDKTMKDDKPSIINEN